MTPKVSITHDVFVKLIEHFQQFRIGGKNTLLIFDGVKSHLGANIVKAAEKYDITMFCLPSNTTHELQPMDKSVFKSFGSFWDDEVLRFWMNNPECSIRRKAFGRIFSEVWAKAMTPGNIISGFKATGIYPFNPSVIPESAYAPRLGSCLTEHENDENDENQTLSQIRRKLQKVNKVLLQNR
ncbi:uncharacterized protein [Diabrotica undecimpunctata]|uniref:uncharacterized protein n=1 Tax=Diabrotica undecimpunctata TaxID=50387 RepID=UPI003B63C289